MIFLVKRADESLLYGNHQNNARAKKAYDSMLNGGVNPEPILLPENEDKQAEVEVKTEVAKDMAEASPDVNDQLPNTDLTAVSKINNYLILSCISTSRSFVIWSIKIDIVI